MTKKTRDWLFRIFVFLFITITTILSLHATGYRFNLSWPLKFDQLLIKTGILALNTEPKGALIEIESETRISSLVPFLNSKKEKITPYKVKNLLPGDYKVSFSMENYWPYEKKVTIYPEQTTFLEDVILFKKSLPLNVIMANPQKILYSKNGGYAYLSETKKIINLTNEQTVFENNNSERISWSDDDRQVYIGDKIFNLEKSSFSNYQDIIGQVEDIKVFDNYLFYLKDKKLGILDINTNSISLLNGTNKILAYEVANNNLFIIDSGSDKTEIKVFDFKGKLISSTQLLAASDYAFTKELNQNLTLLDNEHQIIYIIGSTSKIIDDVIRNTSVFKWVDQNRLIYATKSEIYFYNREQLKSTLITRLGEQIKSLAWGDDNYLAYATENNIGIINITNEGNDITIIWSGNNLSSLYFNNKNNLLYFSGAIGQQSGLYKMYLK